MYDTGNLNLPFYQNSILEKVVLVDFLYNNWYNRSIMKQLYIYQEKDMIPLTPFSKKK